MAILFFLNSKSKGGLELYTIKIAQKLKERGYDVNIYLHKRSELKLENLKRVKFGFEIFLNRWDKVFFCRSADIIFSKFIRAKKKFFINMIGLSVSKKDLYHKFIYEGIDKIFAISKAVKKEIEENLPVEKEKITLIYPGIDTEFFKKDENLREEFRKEYTIADDEVVLCNTSRFDKNKGQKEAIIVFNELFKKFKNIKIFFQGVVEDRVYFEQLKRMKSKNVYFLDFCWDIRKVLCGCDIFLFPSHGEALGLCLLEAMSSQLPSVAFGERAVPEIIEDGVDGFLIRNKDLKEMMQITEILIKDKELRKKIGKKAQEKIIKKFNIENYIDTLIKCTL